MFLRDDTAATAGRPIPCQVAQAENPAVRSWRGQASLPLSRRLGPEINEPVALLKGQSTPSMETIAQTNNKTALPENTAPNVILCTRTSQQKPWGAFLFLGGCSRTCGDSHGSCKAGKTSNLHFADRRTKVPSSLVTGADPESISHGTDL